MSYLNAKDVISGQEATAFIKLNGKIEQIFYATNLKAEIKKKKVFIKMLGSRASQVKSSGFEGSGVMGIYSVTSLFKKMMVDYIKSGSDVYFDLQITNEDPSSSIGKQTILLKNCNIDNVQIAHFDINQEALEESIQFTFNDVDILQTFNKPN